MIFDSELNFVQHCKEKINTAYSYLGVIKRNFIYLDEDAFVMLYKSLVRSHLEYANSVWNPHRLGLIKDLEKVQMHATKLVISIKEDFPFSSSVTIGQSLTCLLYLRSLNASSKFV